MAIWFQEKSAYSEVAPGHSFVPIPLDVEVEKQEDDGSSAEDQARVPVAAQKHSRPRSRAGS